MHTLNPRKTQTCTWTGQSGRDCTYYIYPIGTMFNHEPGNYIFAKQTSTTTYAPVYIGETDDLHNRLPNHNQEPCLLRNGATHVHVHTTYDGQAVRRLEEKDLVDNYQPPCNG